MDKSFFSSTVMTWSVNVLKNLSCFSIVPYLPSRPSVRSASKLDVVVVGASDQLGKWPHENIN